MQSNFAPSIMPRPVKAGKALTSPVSRSGRMYTPSVSPIKTPRIANDSSNPFGESASPDKAGDLLRQPENTSHSIIPTFRKKPIILSGDIRNLESNFQLATSNIHVELSHVMDVFNKYSIRLTPDEAKTLLHEYEENNDTDLKYEAFVDDLVQTLRQTALNKSGTSRYQIKKVRLMKHMEKLSVMHSLLMEEVQGLLAAKLRVSWSSVRDALRNADQDRKGYLTKHEFTNICTQLQVPVSENLLNGLVLKMGRGGLGQSNVDNGEMIDYNEFLAVFGSNFQHGDTNSVGNSLVFARGSHKAAQRSAYALQVPTNSNSGGVLSNTLHSPGVTKALGGKLKKTNASNCTSIETPTSQSLAADLLYMEQLRIVLNEKVSSRYSDVKKAFIALDKDGNGYISALEFMQVLQNFNLTVTEEERDVLLAFFDTNRDGVIDYNEFFAIFGDVMKPSPAAATRKTYLHENSSPLFTSSHSEGGKGINKHRVTLSSPGNELKEAFSLLSDESWRTIFVEFEMSDPKKTGVVTTAEMLRVLSKYLGDLPHRQFNALFRVCGSHVNQLMNYFTLVKSYRPAVMDVIEFFHQDVHSQTDKAFRKSPTESLVMVWSIRVQRAQMTMNEWNSLKDQIWQTDSRRQGRVTASEFTALVRRHMKLSESQAAFLCFFYEDKNFASDQMLIRYGSFLTDYEDPGLESSDAPSASQLEKKAARVEGKGRVRNPTAAASSSNGSDRAGKDVEEKQLREFFQSNIRALETLLLEKDSDKKGFVPLDVFQGIYRTLSDGKWKDTNKFAAFFSKYIAQQQFYYRGFLLDFDSKAGLQTQALVVHDDRSDDDEQDNCGENVDKFDDTVTVMNVYEAKEALRYHLTSSLGTQKALYKLFHRMDPGKSGLLTYPELRRVLERLEIVIDDPTAHILLSLYEDEDDNGDKLGRIKYLQFLHALGGRDPDKLDGMSDLSSHCSYYSAITISPRAVVRAGGGQMTPRPLVSRDYAVAATAVNNAISKQRIGGGAGPNGLSGAAAAAVVEKKIQSQLAAIGKTKWKQLAKAFQQVDSDRRGSVTCGSFRKVLDGMGIALTQEEIVRLQLKYDIEQNGRLNYHEFLRSLTASMSEMESSGMEVNSSNVLPSLATSVSSPSKHSSSGALPDSLRHGVKAKWKAIYSSFKTIDKQSLGRVSAAHFRQLLEWYALPLTDDVFLSILRQFDHQTDGLVDYNKFMRVCVG